MTEKLRRNWPAIYIHPGHSTRYCVMLIALEALQLVARKSSDFKASLVPISGVKNKTKISLCDTIPCVSLMKMNAFVQHFI